MKLSWTGLKISIAGAKLSHLVQKDKIWDHGSMAEQARIIFYLVCKAKATGNIESLRKQCTISCFERLKKEFENMNNRPDMFCTLIKGFANNEAAEKFRIHCSFVRQGEWWVLDEVK
jgi:hypothetical protein